MLISSGTWLTKFHTNGDIDISDTANGDVIYTFCQIHADIHALCKSSIVNARFQYSAANGTLAIVSNPTDGSVSPYFILFTLKNLDNHVLVQFTVNKACFKPLAGHD